MPINVVSPEGKTYSIPEHELSAYQAAGFEPESNEGRIERLGQEVKQDVYGGVSGAAKAAGLGALSGLTAGLSDVAISGLGGRETLKGYYEENPAASFVGNIGGSLVPAFFTGGASAGAEAGLIARGASAGAEAGLIARGVALTPAGAISKLGRAVSSDIAGETAGVLAKAGAATVGAAAEGALYGGGQYLSETALENKPLSAEGFVGGMGKGALFAAPVGGAFSLAGSAMLRARSLFPRSEISKEAGKAVQREATTALKDSIADGDAMLATAKQQMAENEAKAGIAAGREHITRTAFGGAAPETLADQAAAAVDSGALAEATHRLEASQAKLKQWIASGGDVLDDPLALSELEGELAGLRAGEAFDISPEMGGWPGAGVPVGEFGAPGAGGIKTPEELARAAMEASPVAEQTPDLAALGPSPNEVTPTSMEATGAVRPKGRASGPINDVWDASAGGREAAPGAGAVDLEALKPRELSSSPPLELGDTYAKRTMAAKRNPKLNEIWDAAEANKTELSPASPSGGGDDVLGFNTKQDISGMSAEELKDLHVKLGDVMEELPVDAPEQAKLGELWDRIQERRGALQNAEWAAGGSFDADSAITDAMQGRQADLHGVALADLQSLEAKVSARLNELPQNSPDYNQLKDFKFSVTMARQDAARAAEDAAESAASAARTRPPGFLSDEEFSQLAKHSESLLTPEESEVARAYSKNGLYARINGALRRAQRNIGGASLKAVDADIRDMAESLDQALSRAPSPRDMVLVRGLHDQAAIDGIGRLKVGDSFVDPAFVSTSYDEQIGQDYASWIAGGKSGGVVLRIEVPKGYPMLAIPSEFPKERELILGRNGRFTIKSIEDATENGSKRITLSLSAPEATTKDLGVPSGFVVEHGNGKQFSSEPRVLDVLPGFGDIGGGGDGLSPMEHVFVVRPSAFKGRNLRLHSIEDLPAWSDEPTKAIEMRAVGGDDIGDNGKRATYGYNFKSGEDRFLSAIRDDRPVAIQFFPALSKPSSSLINADDLLAKFGRAPVEVPPGFTLAKLNEGGVRSNPGGVSVQGGIPNRTSLNEQSWRDKAYVIRPSDLLGKDVRGIATGDMLADERGIRKAWSAGNEVPAIEMHITPKGKLFIAEGNHRVFAAAQEGDRPILAQFRPISSEVGSMDAIEPKLREALGRVVANPVTPSLADALGEPASAPADDLTALLRGTKNALDEGKSFKSISKPAEEKYVADKAAKTEAAAEHFRAKANAASFEASDVGAAEQAANRKRLDLEDALRNAVPNNPPDTSSGNKKRTATSYEGLARILGEPDLDALAAYEAKTKVSSLMPEDMQRVADDLAIEKLLRKRNGKNVDMGPSLEQAARIIGDHEQASADVADLLGPNAPRTAVDRASKLREASRKQAERMAASAARAADDMERTAVDPGLRAQILADGLASKPEQTYIEGGRKVRTAFGGPDKTASVPGIGDEMGIQAALDEAKAEDARVAAKAEAKAAKAAAKAAKEKARSDAQANKEAESNTAIGTLAEIGVHTPWLSRIPLIGPVLNAFLRAKAVIGVLRRKGGSVGRSTEALIAQRMSETQDRINNATAAILTKAGRGAKRISEVSAGPAVTLGYALFPGGDVKKTKDLAALYHARMDEIARAQVPGAIDAAIGDRYQTADAELQSAIAAQVKRGIDFIASKAPKPVLPPGMLPGDGNWRPSKAALDQWGKYIHAVNDPASVLEDLAKGHFTLEGAQTLQAVYPELFKIAQMALIKAAPQMQAKLPYARQVAISIMYRIPVHPSMQPQSLAYLAAPQPDASGAQPGAQGQPPPQGAPGLTGPIQLGQQTMTPLDKRAGM